MSNRGYFGRNYCIIKSHLTINHVTLVNNENSAPRT